MMGRSGGAAGGPVRSGPAVAHTGPYGRDHPRRNEAPVHELAITQSVVDAVCERAAGRPVHEVRVRVGVLTAVVADSMRFCFGLVTEGTAAEGALLEIDQPPGAGRCRTCAAAFPLTDLILLCACGSADVEITAGQELQIVSMKVG